MKKKNPLGVLADIAQIVVPTLLDKGTTPEEKNQALMLAIPDAVRAFSDLRAENERLARVEFVGHHAAMLAQTAVETCEDETQLKDYARRSVRLADAIYCEALKLAE